MRLLSGQRAFVLQRLTALVLLAYVAGMALRLAFGPPPTYAGWQAWSAGPLGATLLLALAAALLLHAWVGVRDVLLDYVHPAGVRLALLAALAAGLAALAAWTGLIVLAHALSHLSL
jgi:succinate dehydrogenase / fumarate reductase membrane anchor subunit